MAQPSPWTSQQNLVAVPATTAVAMSGPEASSSSFVTKEPVITSGGPDVESQQGFSNPSHWFLILHPHGVTDAVLHYRYPGQGTPESPYVVDFLPQDGSNPQQFSKSKKWTITMLQAVATLAVAFVSTAYSGGIAEIIMYFHVSTIVAILGVSLFVFGFAIGPLLWAPLSGMFDSEGGMLDREKEQPMLTAILDRISRTTDCVLFHILWPGCLQCRCCWCPKHRNTPHLALLRRRTRRIAADQLGRRHRGYVQC